MVLLSKQWFLVFLVDQPVIEIPARSLPIQRLPFSRVVQAYRHLRKSAHQYLNLLSLMSCAGIKDLSDDPAAVLQLVRSRTLCIVQHCTGEVLFRLLRVLTLFVCENPVHVSFFIFHPVKQRQAMIPSPCTSQICGQKPSYRIFLSRRRNVSWHVRRKISISHLLNGGVST